MDLNSIMITFTEFMSKLASAEKDQDKDEILAEFEGDLSQIIQNGNQLFDVLAGFELSKEQKAVIVDKVLGSEEVENRFYDDNHMLKSLTKLYKQMKPKQKPLPKENPYQIPEKNLSKKYYHSFVENYREIPIVIEGSEMMIGGFGRPNRESTLAFQELKEQEQVEAIISLSKQENYAENISEAGMDTKFYTYGEKVDIIDWFEWEEKNARPIPATKYDAVYDAILEAKHAGKKVAMHCGSGYGRTGTALAALKLRETIENAYASNPENYGKIQDRTETVSITRTIAKDKTTTVNVAVTPLVKKAVEFVRMYDSPAKNSGLHSVETKNDIDTLLSYEEHLRKQKTLNQQREVQGQMKTDIQRFKTEETSQAKDESSVQPKK